MNKINKDEFHEAWRKYSENFNTLPLEVRKGLPDWFVRWQEVTMLIKVQEKVLRHLKERQKGLMQHALEWYYKKGIYKVEYVDSKSRIGRLKVTPN